MKKIIHTYYRYCFIACSLCFGTELYAQQYTANPAAQYYRNGYLWNPAYAGSTTAPVGYLLHNNSWIGFDGAPTLDMAAAHFAAGPNSGMGIKVILEKSGILQRNSYLLDYSYTLKFTGQERLRMGISAGAFSQRIRPDASDMGDPSVYMFNGNKTVIDGNFGAVYENRDFSLGGVLYNLNNAYFRKTDGRGDMAKANFMTSYSFLVMQGDSTLLKPMLAYKLYSAGRSIFTAGVQLERSNTFNAALLWQSEGNVIGSVGFRIGKIAEINCSYSSNNKYGYGQMYEIGIGFGLN